MLPTNTKSYLARVAVETARMSWPNRMGRIFEKDTKKLVATYFATKMLPDFTKLWRSGKVPLQGTYDAWHKKAVVDLAAELTAHDVVKSNISGTGKPYTPTALACKVLNTFMHQSMKYGQCRKQYPELHLILHRRVFNSLRTMWHRYPSLKPPRLVELLVRNESPYALDYDEYEAIQEYLRDLVNRINNLNKQRAVVYRLRSRVDLNALLW